MAIRHNSLSLREVQPAVGPLTLAEAKLYLRVDGSEADRSVKGICTRSVEYLTTVYRPATGINSSMKPEATRS